MKDIYKSAKESLARGGVDTPDLDARIILRAVLGVSDSDFITGTEIKIESHERDRIKNMIERRLAGEPVSRILGEREFWGMAFRITPDVLDPRPDTETIIDSALKRFGANPPTKILDLGTGSGCILIALLHEWPQAQGVAVDVSESALEVAEENARRHKVDSQIRFICSDWDSNLNECFDLVVSNPPYIPNPVIANLDREVRNHDPILALGGGNDGLQAYKKIFSGLSKLMNLEGRGFFEIGYDQQSDVMRLAEESGLCVEGIHADLAGIGRVVEISRGDK